MDMRDFFHGVHHVRPTSDGWLPLRFPEEQIDHFRRTNEVWHPRALCPAGVRLSFTTEAEAFTIRFRVMDRVREAGRLELHIDGEFSEIRDITGLHQGELTFQIPEAGDSDRGDSGFGGSGHRISGHRHRYEHGHRRRVDLYLPQSFVMVFQALEISDADPVSPAAGTYVALGDSITQGMIACRPSAAYPTLLARSLGLELANRGVGGHVFDPDSLDESIGTPRLVTIAYGTNDWMNCRDTAAFGNTVAAYFEGVQELAGSAACFVLTPLWRHLESGPNEHGIHLREMREVISRICGDMDFLVIDGTELIPPSTGYFEDGTHPNDRGFEVMGQVLLEKIRNAGLL